MILALLPETILTLAALVVLGLGISVPRARSPISLVALVGSLLAAAAVWVFPFDGELLGGMLSSDPVSGVVQVAVLGLAFVCLVFAHDSFPVVHYAESVALVLFSVVGLLLLAGTMDLLMIFLGLELASVPLYALAALRKDSRASAEAGLKYFLVGSVSAAFLLYGFSLIYGVTGTTNLALMGNAPADPLLMLGIVFTLGGFAFKVAAVPFHLWAPDVYEGAPTAAAALVASGSKVAGVFILAKVLVTGLDPFAGSAGWENFSAGWAPVLALLAGASIMLGNLAAIAQQNVKRLLAYSAIAHGGYLLVGLSTADADTLPGIIFYAIIYALTAAGAFGVVVAVEKRRDGSRLEHFDGLVKSSPVLAICLMVFMVSLAGIPPFAGFFGKFYLFAGAAGDRLWLVVLAVGFNAVSLYYYLVVLKHAFVMPDHSPDRGGRAGATEVLTAVLALLVLGLGLVPSVLLGPLGAGEKAARPPATLAGPSQTHP